MVKKTLTLTLALLTLNLAFSATALAETKEQKAAKLAEKVKANITKLGSGPDARIELKLKDGTKLKGYVSRINENSFVVMDERTATPVEVQYTQPKQVKGNNLTTGVKVVIVVGVILAIAALAAIFGS